MLRPVNAVLLLVMFLWTFNDFNTPFVLFGDAAPQPADLISFHIYNASFLTWNFGSGAAMSRAAADLPADRDRPSTCSSSNRRKSRVRDTDLFPSFRWVVGRPS